jgi:hypothetical protein
MEGMRAQLGYHQNWWVPSGSNTFPLLVWPFLSAQARDSLQVQRSPIPMVTCSGGFPLFLVAIAHSYHAAPLWGSCLPVGSFRHSRPSASPGSFTMNLFLSARLLNQDSELVIVRCLSAAKRCRLQILNNRVALSQTSTSKLDCRSWVLSVLKIFPQRC